MSPTRQPVRVCLLTSSHPVRYTRFFDREAVSLARAGYHVTLVGIGSGHEEQVERGVRLVTVPGRRGAGKLGTLRELARVAVEEKADIYQCLDPWTLRIGMDLKHKRPEVKLVYESAEWFPQMYLDREGMALPLRRLAWATVTRLEERACGEVDVVLETNETRAQRFIKQGCTPVLVPNYPPLDMLPESPVVRKPWLAYTGLVSRPRGFDRLVRALALVVPVYPDTRLLVIGEFDPRDNTERRARRLVTEMELEANVEFLGPLSYPEMFARLRECSIGLILLQPGRGNDFTGLPNKLFEFMGSGLAVIASDFPEIGRVIQAEKCGWLVDPTEPEAIAEAVVSALADSSECRSRAAAGRAAVLDRYHWGIAEQALLAAYRRLET